MTQEHPNFIVLGAPKCGTTSLYDYLVQHPSIQLAPKEIHFFGSDLEFASRRPAFDEYMSYFDGGSEPRLTGDVSVWYLMSERAPMEMYAHNPNIRLVAMLRNPMDLMYSMHGQALYNNDEDESDFNRALALEDCRVSGEHRARSPFAVHATYYRRIAKLGTHLARYREIFPPEQVHAVLLDDLMVNPHATLASVSDFLGISALDDVSLPHSNPHKALRFHGIDAALTYIPRRVVPHTPLPRLPRSIKDKMIAVRRLLRRVNTDVHRRAPMDPDLRTRLTKEFVPEVERLEVMLGRDLSSWKR